VAAGVTEEGTRERGNEGKRERGKEGKSKRLVGNRVRRAWADWRPQQEGALRAPRRTYR
jgi:hypothetical protein